MRQTLIAFALIALLLAACGTSQPGRPSPTVLGTQGPAATQPADTEKPEDPGMPPAQPPPPPHY